MSPAPLRLEKKSIKEGTLVLSGIDYKCSQQTTIENSGQSPNRLTRAMGLMCNAVNHNTFSMV